MNKRLIVKTVLICSGIFILLTSLLLWVIQSNVALAGEGTTEVVTAAVRIEKGTVITESMVVKKGIPADAKNSFMVSDINEVIGTKASDTTESGDYIRKYSLVKKEDWFKDDDRITVLPMEVEERMANLIRKNSYIDIKMIPKAGKKLPVSVLTKILVYDVIDENGVSLGETGVNKKAYVKVILSGKQRDRLYAAKETGRLIYELYCNDDQKQPEEVFEVPKEFYIN